jgi:hypothetical protein
MLTKTRTRLLLAAGTTILFPFAAGNMDLHHGGLWILLGVNIAAYIVVAIMTVLTTLDIAGDTKLKHDFSNLSLWQRWRIAVRENAGWHIAAAAARTGLALSLANFLFVTYEGQGGFDGILGPFFYSSNRAVGFDYVQFETVIIGILTMVIFAFAETGLLVALTLAARRYVAQRWHVVMAVAAARVALIVAVVGVMLVVQSGYKTYESMQRSVPIYNASNVWLRDTNTYRGKLEFMHSLAFNVIDSGTMLGTDVMRPLGGVPCIQVSYGAYDSNNSYYSSSLCHSWDNRPFVLERLFIGWNALQVYAGLIALALWAAWKKPLVSLSRWQKHDEHPVIV